MGRAPTRAIRPHRSAHPATRGTAGNGIRRRTVGSTRLANDRTVGVEGVPVLGRCQRLWRAASAARCADETLGAEPVRAIRRGHELRVVAAWWVRGRRLGSEGTLISADRAESALALAEDAVRGALATMPVILRALRVDDADGDLTPQPTLDRLDRLAAEVSDAGLAVEVRIEASVAR